MVRLTRVSLGRGYEKSRGFEIVTARIVGAIGRTLRKFSRRSARMPRSEERGGRAARSEAEANSRLGYNSPAWKGRLLDYGDAWCRFFSRWQGPDRHSLGRGGANCDGPGVVREGVSTNYSAGCGDDRR